MPEKPPFLNHSTNRQGVKIAQFHDEIGRLGAVRVLPPGRKKGEVLGIGDYDTPVWLTQEQVTELLPLLKRFVETGTI